MKQSQLTYPVRQVVSSLFMMVTLLWLTVSTPYVYAAQQTQKVQQVEQSQGEDTNPFSNTTEEKSQGGVNTLSEYLHDLHLLEHNFSVVKKYYKCYPSNIFLAYSPELLSPPPEA